MSKSVMLAYFAQRPQQFLKYLEPEAAEVSEFCYKGDISLILRKGDDAAVDRLVKDVNIQRENVVAFHYSGHASSDQIFFEKETGNATGLANILGQCPNLQFVFLNGCSTREQVRALFDNKVKVVIATNYSVDDVEAYLFSKYFYEQLFDKRETILGSFQSAVVGIAGKEHLRKLLPETLKGARDTILEVTYRGLVTEINEPVWSIFTSKENDPVIRTRHWLPGKNLKVQLERAYTCGRNPIRGLFREHYEQHVEAKNILHYFIVDNLKNSPEGISIKLLFESFTRNHDPSEPNPFYYPADPNFQYFKDKVIELYSNDQTAAEILERIYTGLHQRPENAGQMERKFEDLYNIPRVTQCRQVFIFIRIQQKAFESIKAGVKDFITASTKANSESNPLRPQLLFFWHLISEEKVSFFNLRPFRRTVAKYFDSVLDVSFLHEDYLKPLPSLEDDDFREWLTHNEIAPTGATADLFSKNRDDVSMLEANLRELIKNQRNQETLND